MPKISRALISVSDKSGVVEFAKMLHAMNVEILSTGGTAKSLNDAGIPVIEVSDYTGSPEIMDGRLKTLHPKIHGGLLAMRSNPKHMKEIADNGIGPIDMVVVNLYPFEATIAKNDCTLEHAIENIDIGGPTMLRAASKNWQDVAVVTDPADYSVIIDEMEKHSGSVAKETCFRLAQKVFAATAKYDAAICNYLNRLNGPTLDNRDEFPSTLGLNFTKVQPMRYGENPHQKAAFYRDSSLEKDACCLANGMQLQGKELSYNNIMDADGALELVKEFRDKTAAVIIKHTNPCGAALGATIAEAFVKARDCDPVSSFGGIVALTKGVDIATAKAIGDTFFEVIIAPDFDKEALEFLKAKKNLRLLKVPPLSNKPKQEGFSLRRVVGGLLVQDFDNAMVDVRECKVVTKRRPTDEEFAALAFGWRVVKHVKSNAIVLSNNERLLGMGSGQTSRVDSVKIAKMKVEAYSPDYNGLRVMASDAFFPFRDGMDLAKDCGCTAVIQPGGSIRDDDVIKAADEHGIAMVFTAMRHFRH